MIENNNMLNTQQRFQRNAQLLGDDADDEINLLDLFFVVLKHKRVILLVCMIALVLMCGITLLMPNIYIATARILPPQENNSGLSAALGSMGDLAALAGISVGGTTGELYVGMLHSRTILDAIIDEFDLINIYETEYRLEAYKALEDHVNISLDSNDGIISVSIEDENSQRAADMANRFVDELKNLNVQINLGAAGRERLFLQNRLIQVKKDLSVAEEKLKTFQEANKAIRIDDQASAIIGAIADLKAEVTKRKVELGVLLSYQTEENLQVKALKETISQLNMQIEKLEQNPTDKQKASDIFIATSQVPELGLQYARLLREFKIQEALYELMTKQFELAKINEARDTSTLQVLDEAVAPDKKSKPKRSMIVLLVTFLSGVMAVFFAFIWEFLQKLKSEDPERWLYLRNQLRFRKKNF